MHKFLVVAVLSLVLVGCGKTENDPKKVEHIQKNQGVVLISTAPDGTKLWRVFDETRSKYVYFAASGTMVTEKCGKNCSTDEFVPTARGK